ncbi:MAG TPA: HK97 family phage prohead protease [Dissulfurispiraceae bacterium]|nr:HK97 family phage prohead protease [Dissulfurispiraceae bacterium]
MQVHTFVLSDETINSYGLRILTAGINTADFERNPVMLLEHKREQLIGRWMNLRKEGGRLLAEADFDPDDEQAIKTQKKVKGGYLKGVSVGIQIQKLGVELQPNGGEIAVVLESRLCEASLCAVPSNSNALKLYDADGHEFTEAELKLNLNSVLVKHHKNQLKMKIKPKLLENMGLADGYTEDALNEGIEAMQAELINLRQQADDARQAAIDTLIDGAAQSGRIKVGQAVQYKSLAEKDYDGVKAILDGMQAPAKPADIVKPTGKPTELSQREGWNFEKWRKEDPKGLLQLKADKPGDYAELIGKSQVRRSI